MITNRPEDWFDFWYNSTPIFTDKMNTTICYSFPDDHKFRYMGFDTYNGAIRAIELLKQIGVIAYIKTY